MTLPTHCDCGGALEVEKVESQYPHEVVCQTIWRRFDILIGRAAVPVTSGCKVEIRATDALRAAAVQLGPEALTLAVKMNKGLGMPHGDVAAVLQDKFGLPVVFASEVTNPAEMQGCISYPIEPMIARLPPRRRTAEWHIRFGVGVDVAESTTEAHVD